MKDPLFDFVKGETLIGFIVRNNLCISQSISCVRHVKIGCPRGNTSLWSINCGYTRIYECRSESIGPPTPSEYKCVALISYK